MEFKEQLSEVQVALQHNLSLMFPDLSDDVLYDAVLDYRNKNDLSCCVNHLLDNCEETRYLMDEEAYSRKRVFCTEMFAEDVMNQPCIKTELKGPDREQHLEVVPHWSCGEEDRHVLRIVMLGKTGSGKSATGNTILGNGSFKTNVAASSVTEKCQEDRALRFGKNILLIDTPGVFDTNVPNKEILKEVAKCISLSLPGPHVFLLVIQIGRFTPEENDTVKHYAEVFGEEMFKHVILVFTWRDALEKNNQSLKEYLQTVPSSLQEIVQKCNNRCIAVDNSSDRSFCDRDARKVMELIDVLVEEHGGQYYTNEMYQTAEEKCREREEEIRRQKDKEKQKEKEEMKRQLKEEYEEKADRLEAEKYNAEQIMSDLLKGREMMEGNLNDKNMKDEEIEKVKKELDRVRIEVQQYKKKAEDAEHQRQICIRDRDERIREQSGALDKKYENNVNIGVATSKAAAVYTMIKGAAELGWGIWNFVNLME